jgi:hypothetical protein
MGLRWPTTATLCRCKVAQAPNPHKVHLAHRMPKLLIALKTCPADVPRRRAREIRGICCHLDAIWLPQCLERPSSGLHRYPRPGDGIPRSERR